MGKKSFILHIDSLDILDDLTDAQVAELFRAIKSYQNGEVIDLSPITSISFSPFKNQFVRDNEKYEKTCKNRAIAGSKGGKQKVANTIKSKQKQAKVADSDSKSDSGSDSKSDSGSKKDRYKNIGGLDIYAFEKYLEYRKESGIKKLTGQGELLSAKKLVGFGNQLKVVEQSIANGWAGLFALKEIKQNTDSDFNDLLAENNFIEGELDAG